MVEREEDVEVVSCEVEDAEAEEGKGEVVEEKRSMMVSKVLSAQDRASRASEYAPLTYMTFTTTTATTAQCNIDKLNKLYEKYEHFMHRTYWCTYFIAPSKVSPCQRMHGSTSQKPY